MLLAELEIRHSRAIAPTRRVALGLQWLPTHPAPGWGGVLLGGVVAHNSPAIEPERLADLYDLIDDLEAGRRVPQPQLRHRFQRDVVGLDTSHHRLHGDGDVVRYEIDDHGRPVPQLLGAVYAAAEAPAARRSVLFRAVRRGLLWSAGADGHLAAWLMGDEAPTAPWREFPTDARWALEVLGFRADAATPDRDAVLSRFRRLVRDSHPDHGGETDGAGQRVLELTQARRILLTS